MDKKFTQKDFSENQLKLSDLFTGAIIGSASTTASFSEDAESSEFLKVYEQEERRFIPQINFSTASNFAKFGSATSYYEDAFTRIHNQYPYDGSQREKVLWSLSSSYLDKYIFDNVYPRTNGYIKINSGSSTYTSTKTDNFYSSSTPQYIYFQGGPHADPYGNYKLDIEAGLSTNNISKANIYKTASDRGNNLEVNLEKGHTIEFWMKKDGWVDVASSKEIIFANFQTGSTTEDAYMWIYVSTAAKGNIYYQCDKDPDDTGVITLNSGISDIADGSWHHYAVTSKTSGSTTAINLYVDGVHVSKQTPSSNKIITAFTGALHAGIGAMPGTLKSGATTSYKSGYGNIVSASFDEFRYWKTERTAKQIGRFYIDQVNGGTNTDLANKELGVYYKFNEGITQTASVDQTILDYSGRISNGTFINYNAASCRSTDSAIVESGKAEREFKDPIIYSYHPDVKTIAAELKIKGDKHDFHNSNSIINSIPAWIVENDAVEGNGELEKLIQILSHYLDTLYLQIEALPTIKNIDYPSGSSKPHFFNRRLLRDYGFDTEEILTDVDLFAYANTRDEKKIFEKKLYDVKNQIYKNIYNNLTYIYKTKGTKKAFRNLLRCIGIDEELVRLNLYGKNTSWTARTNNRNVSSKTKYLDFYNNNQATVYGYPETGNSNSNSYISGTSDASTGIDKFAAITIEADVIFPKYPLNSSVNARFYPSLTASILGMDGVKYPADSDNMTWPAAATNASSSLQLYAVRKQKQQLQDNPEVFFILTGSAMSAPIETSVFPDVYDNTKWKFAIRLKHENQSSGVDVVSGSDSGSKVMNIELYGAQLIADSVINQFNSSSTLTADLKYGPFIKPKRLYCGARRTNFTGSLIRNSDVYVSNVRYWNSYLDSDTLLYHAKNDASYGTKHPYRNTYLTEGKKTTGLSLTEMPEISTLTLNWNFDQVTGSDSSGRFIIADFSSGSNSSEDYKLSKIVQRQHTARGDFFTTSSTDVVERKFEPSVRLVPFDQINSDDMVDIVDFEGEIFTRESRPQEYFFALEKSMYANISDEMLNMFATIRDFHNIVGEPVNRYRKDYKEMEKLRQLFYRRVGNTPDLEKFVEYYKWIDNSVSTMFMNLVPATANFSNNIRTLIESHVLERNKIETKFPTLELNQPEPDGRIKAINELVYDWKHGHHPLNNKQDDKCLYWKDRAERGGSTITSGDNNINSQREVIKRIANSVVSGSTYVLRKLTRPYRFVAERTEDFEIDNAKLNFVKTELNQSSKTANIKFQKIESIKDCNDDAVLNPKQRLDFEAKVNNSSHKGRNIAPFTLYTSSIKSGYKGTLSTLQAGLEINDNHRDVYGTETQEPLQGPFTETHVGGKASRRTPAFATQNLRSEEYNLSVDSSKITLSKRTAIQPKSVYFLGPKAPVSIRNIKTTASSPTLGNYSKEYEVVQAVGADTQKGWLKDNINSVTQYTPEVLNLIGELSFNLHDRTNSSLKNVTIVDRFSGPGSPEAMSLGYLDPASHTFSAYNNINYRNITVRIPRTNLAHSGATAGAAYRYRPFGGNANQSLRVLQTEAPLRTRLRNHMAGNPMPGMDGRLSAMNGTVLTASIHKINRNALHKVEPTTYGGVQIIVDDVFFDNGFVQHPIPQSDRQYSWITASLARKFAGPHVNASTFAAGNGDFLTAPLGYSIKKNDITFASASDIGSVRTGGVFIWGNNIAEDANISKQLDNFAGLNTNIFEPITASVNFLGFPTVPLAITGSWKFQYQGSIINNLTSSATSGTVARILNGIINHRQGPYGWPTWKQIRGGNHPIIRNHKRTNTFSMVDRFNKQEPVPFSSANHGGLQFRDRNILPTEHRPVGDGIIANHTESVVTVNYKPMHVNVLMKGVLFTGAPIETNKALNQKFKFTYGNNTAYFAENRIFNSLTAYNYDEILDASRSRSEAYKAITNLYLPGGTDADSKINPVQDFVSLQASQVVWPRTRNTFLNRTRRRNNYTETDGFGANGYDRIKHRTFWRNHPEDRLRTDQQALNSQGSVLSQSMNAGRRQVIGPYTTASGSMNQGAIGGLSVWPLEGRYTGSAAALRTLAATTTDAWMMAGLFLGKCNFILQQGKLRDYVSVAVTSSAAATGELFSSGMYRSITSYNNADGDKEFEIKNRFVTASAQYHGVDWNMGAYSGSGGYAINPAVSPISFQPQALQYTASSNVEWTTNIDSGKNPWYDSYEDYSADLSVIGKDYSLVPEFNISDHMPYYTISRQSDFLKPLPQDKFIIQGINNSSSANTTFYDEYSHSDFLKNFDLVLNDHRGTADVKTLNLTCLGLKKLLPYNGFYPVTRTLQMATLLSQSIGSQIIGTGSGYDSRKSPEMFPPIPAVQGMQALLQPFFAPGILYNTIKAGLAVDWPMYTGSMPIGSIVNGVTSIGASNEMKSYLSSSANFRLPFEALYDLDKLPASTKRPKKKLYAVTNEQTEAYFDWSGVRDNNLYELAMNNFLAESVNLFLHQGQLTHFKSKPMSEVTFKEDVIYRMSIDIEKTTDFLMTEGASCDSIVNGSVFKTIGPGYSWMSQSYGFHGTSKRGVIYGPAVRFFDVKTDVRGRLSSSGWPYCEQNDPAFAPYTPPYFYGRSTVSLAYKNRDVDTPTPSLATIFSNITASYSNDLSLIPTGSSFTASVAAGNGAPWRSVIDATSPAIQTMMHASASLNLFGFTNDLLKIVGPDGQTISYQDPEDSTNQERWIISTKYECPVLNFNHYTNDTKARGMWNGYGNIPNHNFEGIRVTLRETSPAELYGAQNLTSGSLLQKFFGNNNPSENVAQSKTVGRLPNDFEKSISECIVAIPFLRGNNGNNNIAKEHSCIYSTDDDKFFFPFEAIPVQDFTGGPDSNAALFEFKDSAQALIEKMKRFVFPPRYDFVNNNEPVLSPFVMFAFEFKHYFTKQELADIWQGVMPDIAMRVEPETTSLSIPIENGELMADVFLRLALDDKTNSETTEFMKNLRWMVFKVKQRARNVYANVTKDITDNKVSTFNNLFLEDELLYSYNWPYDYCSLVELAKFEAGVEIKK